MHGSFIIYLVIMITILTIVDHFESKSRRVEKGEMTKRFLRHALIGIMAFIMIAATISPGLAQAADGNIKVTKDGQPLSFDTAPLVVQGRTMVPYAGIAKSLGATVGWDSKAKTVVVTKADTRLKLTIGSTTAYKNGAKVQLDAAPVAVGGRTMVPLRFISEAFGLWIKWDNSSKTVAIRTEMTLQTTIGTVTLNQVPQRVVVLDMYLLDILTSLGVQAVGIAQEDATNKDLPKYLDKYITYPFTWVGDRRQPSTEVIASLKPDLIIGDVKRHKEAYNVLSGIAPTALFTGAGDDDWKAIINKLGNAFNLDDQAKEVLSGYYKQVSSSKAALAKEGKLKVLPVGNYAKNQVRIFTPDSFTGDVLKEIGLTVSFSADGKPDAYISREKLLEIDADVIFLLESPKWTDNVDLDKATIWKDLRAVKAGNVKKVSLENWTFYRGPLAAKVIMNDAVDYVTK
ncbi:MAG TPA: stalk domain-containing protein [Paenibacillus sp.]|uniref:stalk domain-containing protein n=1 Tax=Paenibacillus sp. TaxID=58172 RepID=UPI0028D6FDCD|nr:stalk domain-containing protein [Paenibacillus sp.]HUC92301.1 stalk domain-containing protein [Paenibacillus sp.]